MDFFGEQGPFDDAIIGNADSSGWASEVIPSYCYHCGEMVMVVEDSDVFLCPHCDVLIPEGWEKQHEDAMVMTMGGFTTR